jgi:hypothetical protein
VSARFTVADLAASGVLDVGRNRERVAEAAGLPFHETNPERPARASTAARTKAVTSPVAAARVRTSPSGGPDLHALTLAVLGEPRRLPRLDGEDAIQAAIVLGFDVGTRAGRWSIVPVILRNDIRVRTASEAELTTSPALAHWHQRQQRQAWREGARAKAMGMRPGAPDLLLLSPAGFGFLECKSPGAGLRPEQRAWRDLAAAAGWRWGLARSWDDALRAVTAWGWI